MSFLSDFDHSNRGSEIKTMAETATLRSKWGLEMFQALKRKEYYEQSCANTFENLDECFMENVTSKCDLQN